jgi:hypothetical protein
MRITYPLDESVWIEHADEWKGAHAQRYDQAFKAAEKYESPSMTSFACALALLDNWRIPGLEGNPDHWDFLDLDLRVIAWVSGIVIPSYLACFDVPKVMSSLSSAGSIKTKARTRKKAGTTGDPGDPRSVGG